MWVSQKTIEITYICIYKNWKKIKNPFYKLQNILFLRFKKITPFEYSLKRKLLSGRETFWDNEFYQSYPPLNFSGERNTVLRIKNYWIKKYLDTNKSILDVGWNTGFFSLYISSLVKNIDVLEYNQNLIDIWNSVKKYESITNVDLIYWNFLDFRSIKKYDIICSFAVHKWIGLDFVVYMEKLHWFLSKNGVVFLESQNLEIDPFEDNLKKITTFFEILTIWDTNETSWYKRKFAVLKKKLY